MNVNQTIAERILLSWGYLNVTVGDLDGRNFEARHIDKNGNVLCGAKDRHYKTNEAVKHAFRLADISIECITRRA